MKYLVSLFMILVLLVGCAAPKKAPADVTSVKVFRDVAVTLHADSDFGPLSRSIFQRATDRIRKFTKNRARIDVVYDLDFYSETGLQEHLDLHHSMMIGVESGSQIADLIDTNHPGGTILGVTSFLRDGSVRVAFIMDRIRLDAVDSVVTHELGHVIGFDDLPVMGAIMSGLSDPSLKEPEEFTPADLAECQHVLLCD